MKKNYIAPSTEAATWASMGLMQSIIYGTETASGASTPTQKSTDDVNIID